LSKARYKYNSKTLSYERVEETFKDKIRKFSYHALSGITIGMVFIAVSYNYIKELGANEAVFENENLKSVVEDQARQVEFMSKVLDHIQKTDDNIYRSIFEAEPYPSYKRQLGTGGNPIKYRKYEGYSHSDLVIETQKKIDRLAKQLTSQSKSFDELKKLITRKKELIAAIPSIQPISNKDLRRLASGFGMRMHPIYKIIKPHTGIDFTAPIGTEIYATGNGTVEKVEFMQGYGRTVIINHGFGHKTLYAHCSKFNVRPGQKVTKGDVIAYVGNTGISTAPHLHYEVLKNGKPVDPINFFFNDLTPEEYEEVIRIASQPTQSL
jgi:murein DD-endopeptidase MepM/ murein hydrolase activator NlpD